MKTTVEISDSLLREARELATREGLTLRALIERGLHRIIDDAVQQPPFKLRSVSFAGEGLSPEFQNAGWDEIRDAIYRGRGA